MFQQIPQVFERVIPLAIFLICNVVGIVISKVVFSRLRILLEKIVGVYHEIIVKALKGMPVIWGIIIGSYGAIHMIDFTGYWLHILDH